MAIRLRHGRNEKILLAMHQLARGHTAFLNYEDIVVEAFKMFPDEFALRGHPQYPDSSDVHKPLYGVLKRHGLVRAAEKRFCLTPRGVEVAERLRERTGASLNETSDPERITRDVQDELDRMLGSMAFDLFKANKRERILDTDFYAFLGCTVRTSKNDFVGRLTATEAAIKLARNLRKPDQSTALLLADLSAYLRSRFNKEIKWKRGTIHYRALAEDRRK